jgi:hypothetical protein
MFSSLEDTAPDDAMAAAEAWLRRAGVRFTRKTTFQLKIGRVNFYPVRGSIFVDGEPGQRAERGLNALENVLRQFGLLATARSR